MRIKFIVSRYDESVQWLEPIMNEVIIYNKGTRLNFVNEICRVNVGRETENILEYIIQNYENMPDILIFSQGCIEDHIPVNISEIDYLQKIKEEAIQFGKSRNYFVNEWSKETIYEGSFSPCFNIFPTKKGKEKFNRINQNYHKFCSFKKWFEKKVQTEYPNPFFYYRNSLFAVQKNKVLKHTKNYYVNLQKYVNHHIDPIEGHFLERSWWYIFL
jgi:hypothetical protein